MSGGDAPRPECRHCGISLAWFRVLEPNGHPGRWIPLEVEEHTQETLEGLETPDVGNVIVDGDGWARRFPTTADAKAWRDRHGEPDNELYFAHRCPKAPARKA